MEKVKFYAHHQSMPQNIGKKLGLCTVIASAGFLCGRAFFISWLNPFALSFAASLLPFGFTYCCAAVFSLLGLFTISSQSFFLKYFAAMVIMTSSHLFWNKRNKQPFFKALIASASILLPNLFIFFFYRFTMLFFLSALLESMLTLAITYILTKGSGYLLKLQKRTFITADELISLAFLFAGIICGVSGLYIGHIFFGVIFSIYGILTAACLGGSSYAATAGILAGFSLLLSGNYSVSLIAIFSFSGLFSGLVKKLGRACSAFALLISGAFITFYMDINLMNLNFMTSAFTAVLLFLITPKSFYHRLKVIPLNPQPEDEQKEYIKRVQELSSYRLQNFSESFQALSQILKKWQPPNNVLTTNEITQLVDKVASTVCKSCSMQTFCWENKFYDTYQTVFSILSACENKGLIEKRDIPDHFLSTCIKCNAFVDTTNRLFEKHKTNLAWQNRLTESRELVSEQLAAVSEIINDFSEEMELHFIFKEDLEEAVRIELDKKNLGVFDVIVLENKRGKYEVTLTQQPCFGKKKCTANCIPAVNKALGRTMQKETSECHTFRGKCMLKLIESQNFKVTTGISRAAKTGSQISGDNYSFMELKDGKCLIALSDGMGSGVKANNESCMTIELLEQFIDSGFSEELAVRLINSIFVLKSDEDFFSTLDICCIDLYTGFAQFVKIGASETYILRDGQLEAIRSQSLPVGILKNIDIDETTVKLKDDDIIIMMTDGACANGSEWIAEALEAFQGKNPQDISDYLLMVAKSINNNSIPDDMSILASRIWSTHS